MEVSKTFQKQIYISILIISLLTISFFHIASKVNEKKKFNNDKEGNYIAIVIDKFDFRGHKINIEILSSDHYIKNEKFAISSYDNKFNSTIQIGDTIKKVSNLTLYYISNKDTLIEYREYLHLLNLSSFPKDLNLK